MIEMTPDKLEKLHQIELEMLIEVDRICRKNNINYTIIGGTLLGAVRNSGFIPWDDDADVAMLRPEYDKFVDALKTDLDTSKFYFQDMDNTDAYRWGYGKLRRKDTLFLREHQEHMPYEQGVFIDIFPQDSVPDNGILRKFQDFRCYIVRKFLWSEVGRIADDNAGRKTIFSIMSRIPEKRIKGWYRSLIIRNANDTELVRTLTFPAPKKKFGYKRRWLAKTDDIQFEGYTFRGVKDYDGWLRWEYGNDYMQEPPIEKRKCHPVSAIKLI